MTSWLLTTVLETTAICFIGLTALIGNVSLYIIVYRNKDLQTVTNLYILNLAAADIMVSILSIPFTVVTIIAEDWVFGDSACVALGFFTILSFIASVMSLGMIAINRYFYIVRWNTYSKIFSRRKALLYAAAVWVVALSLASPPLLGWAEYRFIPGKSYCFVYWPSDVYYMYFMITVCFFGPLSVMTFSYYNILRFTRRLKRRIALSRSNLSIQVRNPANLNSPSTANKAESRSDPGIIEPDYNTVRRSRMDELGEADSKSKTKSKSTAFQVTPEETRITNTFIFVVTLFVICWAPFAITMFFDVYYPKPLPRALDMASLVLGYLNSMCNPVLYGLRNSAFKRGFLNLYSKFLPGRFTATRYSVTQPESSVS